MTVNNEQARENFVITRVFNAPREMVFKAWTDADQLQQWWGPKGFDIKVFKFDLRPGGIFHYNMMAGENIMWGRFLFQEIISPERLVFVNSFSDEEGNIADPPFPGNFPREILNIVTFTEEGNKTKVTLKGGPINASEEGHAAYRELFSSMEQGFGGTFDQLDEFLEKKQA